MIQSSATFLQNENLYDGYMKLVSYIANKINVPDVLTCVFKQNELEYLNSNLNVELLKLETRDILTEALEESNVITKMLKHRVNMILDDKAAEATFQSKSQIPIILFKERQASRLMTEMYARLGNNNIYICVEPDILQYRIALINKKLFNIPVFCLNVDPSIHEINMGSDNWNLVDKWKGKSGDEPILLTSVL